MNPRLLVLIYLSIILFPLALAWFSGRPSRSFWDELATGAGMVAFSIILVEFVLSGRFRKVSERIGMDVTMRFHQLLARSALLLAVVHPFLYSSPFKTQYPWDTTRQLTLTSDFSALATGTLAWVLLGGFVLLSIGRDKISYKYETWRLMHGIGALLIAGLALHHALYAGRYSQDSILAVVWAGLFIFAVLTLVYVYFIEPMRQMQQPWKVKSVREIAPGTWELTVEPNQHSGMQYKAGQFVWLNVGNSSFSLHENPFSISSAPASGKNLQFVIKEFGDFTKTLRHIKSGTNVFVDGPHGNLVVSGNNEPGIALIAGGVGVTPLLGILRQLSCEKDSRPSVLVYGNRIEEQIVYREELDTLSQEEGRDIVYVLSEPPETWAGQIGVVDKDLIRQLFSSSDMKEWLFILCGPPVMMELVEDTLIEIGVSPKQIMSERFKYD